MIIRALVVLTTAALVLTGCASAASSSGKEPPTMISTYATPEQSRATTLELFDATKHLIGGTNWELDSEGYDTCFLPDGSEGAEYDRQEGVNVTIDSGAVAKAVAELWESRGYHGVTNEPFPDGVGHEVTYGMDAKRVFFQLGITDSSATIHMSGGCIPGDAQDLSNALVS